MISPCLNDPNNWWHGFRDGGFNQGKGAVEASAEEIALAHLPELGGDKAKGCIVWKISQGKGKQATYPHSVRNAAQRKEMAFSYAIAT